MNGEWYNKTVFISVLEIIVAVLLIGAILLQAQGSGLTSTFGGRNEVYRSRRSMERFLLLATCVLAGLFSILSIVLLIRH